ncbi:MAG: metallophosphoesterase [Nitrososphaerales archaeon]
MRRMRRAWILGAAGAAAVGLAGCWYAHRVERAQVSLDRATVEVDKPGLPPAGLTILHLSDFHFRAKDPVQEVRLQRLRALVADERYDILAFTGDLIHNEAGLPRALAFLSELRPAIAAFSVPGNRDYVESSFKALVGRPEERAGLGLADRVRLALRKTKRTLRRFAGNERTGLALRENDVPAMNAALQAHGFEPLVNRAVNVKGADYDLWFAGVDDLAHGRPDLVGTLASVPAGSALVLLVHNPDLWLKGTRSSASGDRAGPRRADLVLSGHTHGGQIRLPLAGAWYRQGTVVARHHAAGWFSDGASRLFVSRGLGESFPFRFGAPPQAALIRLVPARIAEKSE